MHHPHRELSFPNDFVWGTGTSAYQVEGAVCVDGRGESIWDRFCRVPGAIEDATSGEVACDHYRLWRRDIELLNALGVDAYRFSVAWPRILPSGRGKPNQLGLDFYDRLVDGLLEAGITPWVTLNHWDLPQALEDEGGWPHRETIPAFVDYAAVVARSLGDRVTSFATHNEPWVISHLGYRTGEFAPGRRDAEGAIAAAHHLLVSHGEAVRAIRAICPSAQLGITLNLTPTQPASPSARDHAVRRHLDGVMNRWFLDPLHGRPYPADVVADWICDGTLPSGLAFVRDGDFPTIAAPVDWVGVNYYSRCLARDLSVADEANAPRTIDTGRSTYTDMGWEVWSQGLFDVLMRVWLEYAPRKLFVTENGAAYATSPDASGRIRDVERVSYLHDHMAACWRALEAGVPLGGYFVWSLLDNFEWSRGLSKRFGVCWVDFATQERRLKDSGLFFSRVTAENRLISWDEAPVDWSSCAPLEPNERRHGG